MKSLKQNADGWFSKFIRLRKSENGKCECFTCGKIDYVEKMDCGHFISRKHLATRFDEINCEIQCKECNQFKNGNLILFEKKLIREHGIDAISNLKYKSNQIKKYSQMEFQEIIDKYKKKVNEIS